MNKNIELRGDREVMNNVNVNNVNVVNEDNPEQVLLSQEVVNVNVNDVNVDVNNVNKNVNVNNLEQVLLSQEVLLVNVDHRDVDVNAEAVDVNNVDVNNMNVNNPEQVLLVNVDHMDVSREEDIDIDIVNAPRLKRTHQEKGENGKKVKEVKLDKETGNTLEKEKVKRVTEDTCDNEDT
jgi:hypothetical protein